MANADTSRRMLAGSLFLLGVDAAYNVYGGTNSSPQTTELFAAEREHTLMKYVRIGGIKVFLYTIIASVISRSWWPLIGGAMVAAIMHTLYRHAAKCGKQAAATGTVKPDDTRAPSTTYETTRP